VTFHFSDRNSAPLPSRWLLRHSASSTYARTLLPSGMTEKSPPPASKLVWISSRADEPSDRLQKSSVILHSLDKFRQRVFPFRQFDHFGKPEAVLSDGRRRGRNNQ